jgi:triphosphatase
VRDYAAKAAALQEMLGVGNDAAVAASLLGKIDTDRNPQLAFAAGLVLGWCGRARLADEDALQRAWRKVKKAEPFWLSPEEPELQVH